MRHVNVPNCPQCQAIINRYPNPHPYLVKWALALRSQHTEAHISAFGRGKADQEGDFLKGVSRAHYGQSPHNYNAAVDWFRLTLGGANFDAPWFNDLFGKLNDPALTWGGSFLSIRDLPHVEWAQWEQDVASGLLKLVE